MKLIGTLNTILDEMSDLQDEYCGENRAQRYLFNRWREEIMQVRDELATTEDVRGELQAQKYHVSRLEQETTELRKQVAEAKAKSPRAIEILDKLTDDEVTRFRTYGTLNEFLAYLAGKQYINGIKMYRATFDSGLKEAKDRVEVIVGGSLSQ